MAQLKTKFTSGFIMDIKIELLFLDNCIDGHLCSSFSSDTVGDFWYGIIRL